MSGLTILTILSVEPVFMEKRIISIFFLTRELLVLLINPYYT